MDIQKLFNLEYAYKPYRKDSGELNDGTFFMIDINIEPLIMELGKLPSKKMIIGKEVKFLVEDLDNDEEVAYIGLVKDYRFKDDYKKNIVVSLKDCKRK